LTALANLVVRLWVKLPKDVRLGMNKEVISSHAPLCPTTPFPQTSGGIDMKKFLNCGGIDSNVAPTKMKLNKFFCSGNCVPGAYMSI